MKCQRERQGLLPMHRFETARVRGSYLMPVSLNEDTAHGKKAVSVLDFPLSKYIAALVQRGWVQGAVAQPGVLVVQLLQGHLPAAGRQHRRGPTQSLLLISHPRRDLRSSSDSYGKEGGRETGRATSVGLANGTFIPKYLDAGRD